MNTTFRLTCVLAGLLAFSTASWAGIQKPTLTPAQEAAAAAKKAAADAKVARDKALLAESMDAISARWRAQAPEKGWRIQPPVTTTPASGASEAVIAPGTTVNTAAPPAIQAGSAVPGTVAGAAPSAAAPPVVGMPAAKPARVAPGAAPAAPATGAAPLSREALNAAKVPIKSEKLGTAPPSEDIKRRPTGSVPRGVAPAVEKEHSPQTANKE